jgi:hypothetical protein
VRTAKFARVGVDDVLTGKFPLPGVPTAATGPPTEDCAPTRSVAGNGRQVDDGRYESLRSKGPFEPLAAATTKPTTAWVARNAA